MKYFGEGIRGFVPVWMKPPRGVEWLICYASPELTPNELIDLLRFKRTNNAIFDRRKKRWVINQGR